MCKRVQLLCVSKFENYKSIKSQLPKVWVISAIKGCFVKGIYIKMPGSLKCDIWFGALAWQFYFLEYNNIKYVEVLERLIKITEKFCVVVIGLHHLYIEEK